MIDIDYDSPIALKSLLESRGLTVKKRFGQNFLINKGARTKIIDSLGIKTGDRVWEIGPGVGSLTHKLVEKEIQLTVFEIDRGFVRVLEDLFEGKSGLKIVTGDFIHTWKQVVEMSGLPDIIVGNLPYSSAAAIILSLTEGEISPRKLVCTVQKESAQRMTAREGSADYSSFSVLCSLIWNIRSLGDLKGGSFYPPPKVKSTVLELLPSGEELLVSRAVLLKVVRELFAGRRKTIRNNVIMFAKKIAVPSNILLSAVESTGIDTGLRPGDLDPQKVQSLVLSIEKHLQNLPAQGVNYEKQT
ncbi:MAG: ribosomal RNA small subunit methyltransferase A [Spirochaetales bacterium]|jgi:16S rRNA (adenine1518-N6/adenine1519-N6)-dimethyltransferase|nr:ribosomal RNA small subunit methyltransferase A [Spirochaetales bacterium]